MTSLVMLGLLPPLAFAVLGACGEAPQRTMEVKTTSATVSSVARYRTYSHAIAETAPRGYAATSLTPEVLEKMRGEIDFEMQKRGYVRAEEDADLVVRISSGVRVVEDQPTGAALAAGAPAVRERISALVVDIFDRRNDALLYHGYARDEVHGKRLDDKQIKSAVTQILAPLPGPSELR